MKTALKEINSYTRQLNVIVEWDSLQDEYLKEYKKACSNYNIPGFRKGKVPEKIVKKNNSEVLYLPPYSPDLNPIEHCGTNFKSKLRKLRRKGQNIQDAITQALKETFSG